MDNTNQPPVAPSQTPPQGPVVPPPQPSPTNKSKKLLLIIGAIVLSLAIGMVAYLIAGQTPREENTNTTAILPTSAQTISPTISNTSLSGIPIKENTVSYTEVNSAIYMRYRGKIYSEEAANKNDATLTSLPNPDNYTWYGLVDAPKLVDDAAGFDELFDFKVLPDGKNFLFIMRWPTISSADSYKVFSYMKGQVTEILSVNTADSEEQYNVPRFQSISDDGRYVAFTMFECWNCGGHQPETMLFDLQTERKKWIGKTSQFAWKDGGNYEYKEFKEIECNPPLEGPGFCSEKPENLPLKSGSM